MPTAKAASNISSGPGPEPADYWPAYYALLEGIKTAFDQRSVEMPYNHLNVHIVDPVRVERETKA